MGDKEIRLHKNLYALVIVYHIFGKNVVSKDVYIAADRPNIVRVKKAGVTWDDFFKILSLTLTKDCLTTGTKETFCTNGKGILRFYLNGKEDTNALDKQIVNGDSLLISFGTESDEQIQKQLQQIPRTN